MASVTKSRGRVDFGDHDVAGANDHRQRAGDGDAGLLESPAREAIANFVP